MDIPMSGLEESVSLLVREELAKSTRSVPVGVSNRHVHLCRKHMDALFGPGSRLTVRKPLGQPGQYAAEETVTLEGPRGKIENVRVLGPLRNETQVEISITDGRLLGVAPVVNESGNVVGTPGMRLVGPRGTAVIEQGVIAALRHIHLSPYAAKQLNLSNGEVVSVELGDDRRGGRMDRVLVRVAESYAPEMHIDVDEANAFGVQNNDMARILSEHE